jgi:hypothetical protein
MGRKIRVAGGYYCFVQTSKFMNLFAGTKNLFGEDCTESGCYMLGRTVYDGMEIHF